MHPGDEPGDCFLAWHALLTLLHEGTECQIISMSSKAGSVKLSHEDRISVPSSPIQQFDAVPQIYNNIKEPFIATFVNDEV